MTDRDTTANWKPGRRAEPQAPVGGVPLHPGEVVGDKYEIVGVLGQGGMGAVVHARHVRFRRDVAIKVLHPMLARDEMMVRRFEREAQAAGRIGSAHIAEVFDTGSLRGGERYIVMEYLDGESLAERLDRVGTLSQEELYPIVVQILEGLATAHDARFVHRDLKPSNVFLARQYEGREDFVKILDFGVSKLNTVDAGDVTETGVLLGTPHYMAPEFIKGARHVDHRCDIYAVGVIMFRALSGLTPFVADNAYALIHKIAREDAPPLRNFAPDADPQLAAIVDRALRRDLEARFDDARQFLAAMQAWSPTAMQPLRVPAGSMPPPRPAMRAQAPTVVPAEKDDSARRATRIVALAAGGVAIFAAGALASTWWVAADAPAEKIPTAVESLPRVDAAIAPAAAEADMAAAAEVVTATAREAAAHAAARAAAAQVAADEAEKAESKTKGSAAAPGPPSNRTPQRVAPKVGDVTF